MSSVTQSAAGLGSAAGRLATVPSSLSCSLPRPSWDRFTQFISVKTSFHLILEINAELHPQIVQLLGSHPPRSLTVAWLTVL